MQYSNEQPDIQPEEAKEVHFNNYNGFWIGMWGDTVMWIEPNTEDIKFYKVPRMRKGYTFYSLSQTPNFNIKLVRNEEGLVIMFFIDPDENVSFGLVIDDLDRSQWYTAPLDIQDSVDTLE